MHTITGLLMLVTIISGWTIVFGLSDWKIMFGWAQGNRHPTLGNITVLTGIIVTIGGIAAESLRRYGSYDWRTTVALSPAKIHKVFGYLVIFFSQATVSTGICYNYFFLQKHNLAWTLVICNLVLFVTVLAVFEALH